jgi:O-antigen/teichoic acid export membrane protein
MALQYVFYPRFAQEGPPRAVENARRLVPKAASATVAGCLALWLAAGALIPAFYGSGFGGAVTPTRVILLGLTLDGVAGLISGLLYGAGRPGLNSWAMAAGLSVTVALDLLLIPRFGATGAAIASALAYTTTAVTLLWFFWRLRAAQRARAAPPAARRRIAPAAADETAT